MMNSDGEGEGEGEGEDAALAVGRQQEAWERAYEDERSWEALVEDKDGRLMAPDTTAAPRAKRQRLLAAANEARIRRGMIRYCVLVLDLSVSVTETDLRPSRLGLLAQLLPPFIRAFFSANPLSQLGLSVARHGLVERLTELGGSPEAHVAALARCLAKPGCSGGQLSLQNVLDQGVAALAHVPPYGTRELLLLQSALTSCDPGIVFASETAAMKHRVRVSIVGLAAEVYVARRLAEGSGGSYGVALSEAHLEELIHAHAPPPPALAESTAASLVTMGFPQRAALLEEPRVGGAPSGGGTFFCAGEAGEYVCPRCRGRVAELPGTCKVCRLTLVSSPLLARSYHHLFPVTQFDEQPLMADEAKEVQAGRASGECHGCAAAFAEEGGAAVRLRCPRCLHDFCFSCDAFVHEHLHNCPGCEAQAEACA